MKPWWEVSVGDGICMVVWLTISYAILGSPHGWGWLTVAPSIFFGLWLWRVAAPWAWRRFRS